MTALHWAAINNHLLVAQRLIEHGADVDAVGGDLMATPLLWAVRPGHLAMCRILIQAGASANVRDRQGFTALHLAAQASACCPCPRLWRADACPSLTPLITPEMVPQPVAPGWQRCRTTASTWLRTSWASART